ncbi:MAG TPA: ParB/RepB/Spo0J family partition protein [Acetobacteraceae bacterium]|nr:ParB/RepB/Spo0J family partition protein [Acetobacteraceae bacterium]
MALGNRGFAQGLTGAGQGAPAARLPPRTGILDSRENRLAALAAGNSVTRVHELVDPARCRIWEGHNRDYGALSPETCADLIESFKAQGRQEVPAIVRRVVGDPDHEYEVICGARRHWSVAWMRAHDYPDFKFLVEPRELTDEEAFRVADLENRSRRDLSDYERARDYARAVERYYDGSQQRMAERLEVTKSWLSRYLELARLPDDVLAAFGSPQVIGISHAAVLAPLLRIEGQRDRVLAEARAIRAEQAALAERRAPWMPPAAVMRRLTAIAAPAGKPRGAARATEHLVRAADGAILARGQKAAGRGGVSISIPAATKHPRAAILTAVAEILDAIGATQRPGEGDR